MSRLTSSLFDPYIRSKWAIVFLSDSRDDVTSMCVFCPSQVKVLFAGQDIDRSPFVVNVSKALGDPNRVQARGPGLQPTGNVANKPTYFDIYTAGKSDSHSVFYKVWAPHYGFDRLHVSIVSDKQAGWLLVRSPQGFLMFLPTLDLFFHCQAKMCSLHFYFSVLSPWGQNVNFTLKILHNITEILSLNWQSTSRFLRGRALFIFITRWPLL